MAVDGMATETPTISYADKMGFSNMDLQELATSSGEWLRGSGPESDIVISSRVRLARNLADFPFIARATDTDRAEIGRILRGRIETLYEEGKFTGKLVYVDVSALEAVDRQFLVERQLISREHADAEGARAVVIDPREQVSVMINEEDHLRIQVMKSGLDLAAVWEQINQLDDLIEARVTYAYNDRFGYLTACPTNVGTGIRVSVMLHLPALKLTGEIEKVFRAAKDMRLAVRGLYGEGTEATGDLYQISNQTTLGKTEDEIVSDFKHLVIPKIIDYEVHARKSLASNQTSQLDDKVFRALGLLRSARLIASEETLFLLSHLRMGVNLGRIKGIEVQTINELVQQTQPAHLQKILGRKLEGDGRRAARAEYIRQRLGAV
jgi:protein arginine kinase